MIFSFVHKMQLCLSTEKQYAVESMQIRSNMNWYRVELQRFLKISIVVGWAHDSAALYKAPSGGSRVLIVYPIIHPILIACIYVETRKCTSAARGILCGQVVVASRLVSSGRMCIPTPLTLLHDDDVYGVLYMSVYTWYTVRVTSIPVR